MFVLRRKLLVVLLIEKVKENAEYQAAKKCVAHVAKKSRFWAEYAVYCEANKRKEGY